MSARLRGARMALAAFAAMSALAACSLSSVLGTRGQQGQSTRESISGIVITSSGAGIPAATVSAGATSTLTDSSGDYTLAGLSAGSYTITVSKSNYAFSPSSQSETVNGSSLNGVDFSGQPNTVTYSLSGNVSAGGSGMVGITVSLGALTTTTDSSGNFTFSSLANGTYTVTVSYPDYTFTPSSQSETISGASVTGVDFTAATVNGLPAPPAVPTVTTYTSAPNPSAVVLVAAPTLSEDFEPTVTGATPTSTGVFETLPAVLNSYLPQRIQLVDTSGSIVVKPTLLPVLQSILSPNVVVRALAAKPVLELTEYWQLLGNVNRYAAGTIKSVTTTYTYGVSSTQTSSFASTVGASATASVGVGPAKFSATVSTQFSSTTSSSMDITSTQSTQTTFKVIAPSNENVVYTLWQLVYELRLALYDPTSSSADQFGYVPYTDPSFTFSASDMAPVYVYQQLEIVPETQFFPPTS